MAQVPIIHKRVIAKFVLKPKKYTMKRLLVLPIGRNFRILPPSSYSVLMFIVCVWMCVAVLCLLFVFVLLAYLSHHVSLLLIIYLGETEGSVR